MDLRSDAIKPDEGTLLRDLRSFLEVARALTSALDLESVLRAVMSQMAQFFSPSSWSLLLVDEPQQELTYAIFEGHFDSNHAGVRIPMAQGMAGWVAAKGETLIIPDVPAARQLGDSASAPFSEEEQRVMAFKVQSAICMPLKFRGRTVGVIQLFNYPVDSLNDYAITFLHILTDYAAIAIENARVMERVHELTITDDCTQLFNTRYLHTALQTEFERARRFQTEFSVIFVDLDYFKAVNDVHGHLIGTELLVEVAQLIKRDTRNVDQVFRYGGDEFVILLPQTGKEAAVEAAQRLREALKQTTFLAARGMGLAMSASFGVSTFPHDGDGPEGVLKTADAMMYRVKRSTRDDIAFA